MKEQFYKITFKSLITKKKRVERNIRLFSAAVKALEPINGVAIAWFPKEREGYLAIFDQSCFARIAELGKTYGFETAEPIPERELVSDYEEDVSIEKPVKIKRPVQFVFGVLLIVAAFVVGWFATSHHGAVVVSLALVGVFTSLSLDLTMIHWVCPPLWLLDLDRAISPDRKRVV